MNCQCSGCPLHTRHPCKRTRPLNRLDGMTLCSPCLNRRLEIERRRLYPEIIPDVT